METKSMAENRSGGPGRGEIPASAQGLAPAPVEKATLTGKEDSGERPHQVEYEPPDLDNEYEDDEDGWLEDECGLMADGQCAMAGTEHCDFTCPNRDSEDFCGSAAWNKKHAPPVRP